MYVKKVTTTVTPAPTPAPAPIPTPTPAPAVEYFRVRTSWKDSKSQKGAYKTLENAIKKCQEVGEGYHVFDNEGNKVYSYEAPKPQPTPVEPTPIQPKPEPTPVTPEPVEPEEPKDDIDVDKVNTLLDMLIKFIKLIGSFFKKK